VLPPSTSEELEGRAQSGDDPILTGKIALAHRKEFPDYYERLGRMERDADGTTRLLAPTADVYASQPPFVG
jgi:hypothetical protein